MAAHIKWSQRPFQHVHSCLSGPHDPLLAGLRLGLRSALPSTTSTMGDLSPAGLADLSLAGAGEPADLERDLDLDLDLGRDLERDLERERESARPRERDLLPARAQPGGHAGCTG